MRSSPSSRRIFCQVSPPSVERKIWPKMVQKKIRSGSAGIGRDPPDRRVRRLRQVDDLPGLAPVAAAEQHPPFARRLVADRKEHDAGIVRAFRDAAEIGPGGVRHVDELPAPALVAAAVQAFLGRAQDCAAVPLIVVEEDEIVGVRALQPRDAFVPGLAAVAADEHAVDLDGDPDRLRIARVEMDRRHPRRVDELAFHAVADLAAPPGPPAVGRAVELRRARAGEDDVRDRGATGRSAGCAARPSARADAPSGRPPRSSGRRRDRCPPARRRAAPDGSRRTRRGIRCRCRRSA